MNFYYFFDKKIFKKSLPFYLPISLGVINKLNNIALFVIPLQAINSIIKQRLSPRIKETFEIFKFPIPNDDNLFLFFFILILLSLLVLVFSNFLRNFLILRIKKKIFLKNKNKIINKDSIHNYTKKFEKVNYYIETTEDIIFCSILVLIIVFLDYQIALITLLGGTSYYLIINKLRWFRVKSKKEKFESIILDNEEKSYFRIIFEQFSNDKKLSKSLSTTIIMLIILFAVYKRSDPTVSIIFIFLVRIFQNQMIQSLNQFISQKELSAYFKKINK